MVKSSTQFEFTYTLGGVVVLECKAVFRFGRCVRVVAYFGDKVFDADGLVVDWDDEFLPMAESLMCYAQQFYDEAKKERLDGE